MVSSTFFLTRFLMSPRSDSSSTDTMLSDTARVPFACGWLLGRLKSYAGTPAVLRYAVVNLRRILCVTGLNFVRKLFVFAH